MFFLNQFSKKDFVLFKIEKNKKQYFIEMVTFATLARICDGDVFRGAITNAGITIQNVFIFISNVYNKMSFEENKPVLVCMF